MFCVIQGSGNNVALGKVAHVSTCICNIHLFTYTHNPMLTRVLNYLHLVKDDKCNIGGSGLENMRENQSRGLVVLSSTWSCLTCRVAWFQLRNPQFPSCSSCFMSALEKADPAREGGAKEEADGKQATIISQDTNFFRCLWDVDQGGYLGEQRGSIDRCREVLNTPTMWDKRLGGNYPHFYLNRHQEIGKDKWCSRRKKETAVFRFWR